MFIKKSNEVITSGDLVGPPRDLTIACSDREKTNGSDKEKILWSFQMIYNYLYDDLWNQCPSDIRIFHLQKYFQWDQQGLDRKRLQVSNIKNTTNINI